ncbi:MAG: ribosomal protein S18-alanine N-acetyltransferase [Clostridia bacterium]|nr:ribosomal protein S18-alanine N-acetyltransferase [Clostridia bacterium]
MKNILFVCSGNTCRSPMAEGIFNKIAKEKGLPFFATSCGVATYGGDKASPNSLKVCKDIGVDLNAHISRGLTISAVEEAYKIYPLADGHFSVLKQYFPNKKGIEKSLNISDPFGGDEETYKKCREEIEEKIDEIFEEILRENCDKNLVSFAGKNDVKTLTVLGEKYFHDFWDEETLKSYCENPLSIFLKSFDEKNELSGYICGRFICETAEIDRVVVDEKFRGKGFAKSLINEFEKIAKSKGVFEILLEVRRSNAPAISLYEKSGFVKISERKGYYSNPTEDAIIMRKEIIG